MTEGRENPDTPEIVDEQEAEELMKGFVPYGSIKDDEHEKIFKNLQQEIVEKLEEFSGQFQQHFDALHGSIETHNQSLKSLRLAVIVATIVFAVGYLLLIFLSSAGSA